MDGFSLVNHGQFANFAKLSCHMVNNIGCIDTPSVVEELVYRAFGKNCLWKIFM